MVKVLAVLDTMWGSTPGKRAPHVFRINRRNHSGRRLYSIVDLLPDSTLWVTNCASVQGGHANDHRFPDLSNLTWVLGKFHWNVILVCGGVAKSGWNKLDPKGSWIAVKMPHPASRNFPNSLRDRIAATLCSLLEDRITGIQLVADPPEKIQAEPLGGVDTSVRFPRHS